MKNIFGHLFFLAIVLAGCDKLPLDAEEQYGAATSPEEIGKYLFEGLGNEGPEAVKYGDEHEFQMYRIIAQNPAQYLYQVNTVVVARSDDSNSNIVRISYMEKVQRYEDNQLVVEPWREYDEDYAMERRTVQPFVLFGLTQRAKRELLVPKANLKRKLIKTTYHNLKTSKFDEPVPEWAYVDGKCQDIPECKLHAIQINFDVVEWYQDTTTTKSRKIAVEQKIAKELPYLARIYHQCLMQEAQVGNTFVLVTDCEDLKNFKIGVNR